MQACFLESNAGYSKNSYAKTETLARRCKQFWIFLADPSILKEIVALQIHLS